MAEDYTHVLTWQNCISAHTHYWSRKGRGRVKAERVHFLVSKPVHIWQTISRVSGRGSGPCPRPPL